MSEPPLALTFERPEVSNASRRMATNLDNFYHVRHRKEYIQYLIRNDISHGCKYVLNGKTSIIHLISQKGEWYHFQDPGKPYFKVFIDRANAVCIRAKLPTLHRMQDIWFWSDGIPWEGYRTLRVKRPVPKLANRLRAILSDAWIT